MDLHSHELQFDFICCHYHIGDLAYLLPNSLFLTRLKHKQLLLMLVVLPTWINLLLKAYAFMGIFGQQGGVNAFLSFVGIGPKQILFTDFSFILLPHILKFRL